MDSEGSPALEVAFVIDPQFGGLAQLQQAMDSTDAKVLQQAQAIERATSGMVNLGGATAQVRAFGPAATRELQSVAAETNRAERAGEGMVRNLLRQAETFGKTAAEIRNMRAEQRAAAAEAQGLTELAGRIRAANAELVRLEGGQVGVSKGSAQMRAAMQGASFQVQDLITQISMGTNPINALAVQGGQLAGQFANVEGRAGKLASFLIGPWGLAITAGTMILAPFIAKLLDGNSALDDAVDKLKEDARQTEVSARAKNIFATSVEGVRKAILDQREALDQSAKAMWSAGEQSLIAAHKNYENEVSIRRVTVALLEKAKAEQAAANSQSFGAAGGAGAGMAQSIYANRTAELEQRVADQNKLIIDAERNLNRARVGYAAETAKVLSTEAGKITREYDRQIRQLQFAADAQAAAGKGFDASIGRQIRALEQRKAAALDAAGAQDKLNKATASAEARDTATAASVAAQLRRELKGVQVTSTTGGKHVAGSDHYANRAIDFVPAGGMGSMSKADVRALFERMGLPIRRNAAGVEQLFGPGDKGHNDHWHVAWEKGKHALDNYRASLAAVKPEQAEAEREAKRLLDQATGFLANLTNETGRIGKTAMEIKELEINAAAAAAPTKELRAAIYEAGNAWKTATEMGSLSKLPETLDIGDLSKMVPDTGLFRSELDLAIEKLTDIADQAQITGDALAAAFGQPGAALGGLLTSISEFRLAQAQLTDDVVAGRTTQANADKQLAAMQTRTNMQAIAGVKSLFKEKSAAFKAISAIEKAYALWQAAETIASMVRDTAKTASAVANSTARATAAGAEGVATQSKLPFPYNIAAMAATGAALIAAGIAVFGGGGGGGRGATPPTSAEDMQAAAGTGTILGDSKAQSESIRRSLEIVAANTNRDLEYSNDMLRSLRSIDTGISKLAGTVAQQIQVAGSMFDTSGQNLGTTGKNAFLGLFGGSSTTRSLYDLGLEIGAASVGSILSGGIGGSTYQTIEQIKKTGGFLGIGGGTKTSYQTSTGAIDPSVTSAINDVVRSLRNGLVSAADVIGMDGAAAILDSFQVSIGRISFKDISGEEIERQLNAIFSSIGDQMATQLLPSLSSLQLVGEGLFETFTRVAREYQVVDVTLASMGRTFGAVGMSSVAARDALVQLFGSLDDFVESSEFFRDKFLSEAEQIAPVQAALMAELQRLGAAGLTTRDQFKQAVQGLDLTTDAGRRMYASLLAVAPAFDKVLAYQEQAQKKTIDGLKSTVDQFGKLAESLKKYRDGLFLTEAAQGNAYGALLSRFNATADLAKGGDQKALQELESAGKALLDASLNNSSTREQYLRDVALVARGVDAGIFAAEETADYAQLQLDALGNAVTILGAIERNTAVSSEATAFLDAVRVSGLNAAASAPSSDNSALAAAIDELSTEVAGLRSDTNNGLAAVAGGVNRTARTLEDVTAESGGTAFNMVNLL